jgi:predicted PurR-regulated permease PerM
MSEATATTLRRAGLYAGVVALLLLAWQLRHLLLLVFAAVLIATLLRTAADGIARRTPLGPQLSLAAAVLLVATLLLGMLTLAGAQLSAQLQDVVRRMPAAWDVIAGWLDRFDVDRSPTAMVREALPSGAAVVARVGAAATSTLGALANFVIVVAGGLYLAAQPGLYRRGIVLLLPPSRRERAARGLEVLGDSLRRWLTMQLAAMAIVGTTTGLALWALGVPSPLALGLIAGLLEFVPIVGPLLAAIPAVLVAFSVSPELALWAAAVFFAIQQLEGYVLTPVLARHAVDLPPALTLFALTGFATLFGLAGALLAAPLMVVVYVGVREFYVEGLLDDGTTASAPRRAS